MNFPVNPEKVLRLFSPLWGLLAFSLWLHWESWQSKPIMLAAVASLPLVAALAAGLMRERWRLELTAEALVHHTLGRTERFAWSRMGPVEIKPSPLRVFMLVRALWFAYPLDAPRDAEERATKLLGRRILCVFGDHSPRETVEQIQAWRALNARG
ncbi:hypothetical protein [Terricaulis sp.]|uniref:hypothetical protein n=1 Tax=Terricaulis sp. TaxID=2768686 RepID=UPI002AC446CF|nr:hypothetical protein [Terricaulis sp.]MDZ4692053.1 hypothetical protein [Terricaulis sp.]